MYKRVYRRGVHLAENDKVAGIAMASTLIGNHCSGCQKHFIHSGCVSAIAMGLGKFAKFDEPTLC